MSERQLVGGHPAPDFELRTVEPPLTDAMLRPARSGRGVVQFHRLLSDNEFERLANWLRQYPDMALRAYGSNDGSIRDLEFLRYFTFVQDFSADALYHSLESLDGLRHLGDDLDRLAIGLTRRRLDLGIVARFRSLKTLYLEGQTKNIDVIAGLTSLEDLTLRSITLPDLSLLLPLTGLLSLDIKLGGTKDLSLLPRIGQLRYLELWLIKGLLDVSTVGRLPHLRHLFLQALKHVDSLPNLSEATTLRRVHLETMNSIRDLRSLATAPSLEEVVLVDMPQLTLDDLRPLVGLAGLRAARIGLGSMRKNAAAQALLGLPDVHGTLDWRDP